MIQITLWLNPNDMTWCNKRKKFITTDKWLQDESLRIEEKKKCKVVIKSDNDGNKAVFREKLK